MDVKKKKIIVENNEIIEIESNNNKTLITKNYPTNKITKEEITLIMIMSQKI